MTAGAADMSAAVAEASRAAEGRCAASARARDPEAGQPA